jgi:hypothetical protein
VPQPYQGDDPDDERYTGWSYLGDRYVCPLADEDRTCHRHANELLTEGNEDELRAMAADGHRCAFVRLMELLVELDRTEDLRNMALQGDGRADTTLMEYLYHRKDQEGLRREAAHLPNANLYLAQLLADDHQFDEALNVLAELETHPDHAHTARRLAARLRNNHAPNGHDERSPP